MTSKAITLTGELRRYIVEHSIPRSDVHHAVVAATHEKAGAVSQMQIPHEQGALLTLLVRLVGAKRAIEVGTFTGYSAICIAEGLPLDGQLICCDISVEWTSVGRPFWREAGVDRRIDLRIAPAEETLASLSDDGAYDFAFLDADKGGYISYYEHLVRLLRPGGLLVADNVLWGGEIANPEHTEADTRALRAFNDHVAADDRVDSVIVNVADGLSLVRKR